MLPTAAAAWAALGEGGTPAGSILSHRPVRTSRMCTSLVAPARRIPAAKDETASDVGEFVMLGQLKIAWAGRRGWGGARCLVQPLEEMPEETNTTAQLCAPF